MIKAVVIHSGGMDSSLCLALAIQEFKKEHVLSLSFHYGQRHSLELLQAAKISSDWGVLHHVIDIPNLPAITTNALTDHSLTIAAIKGESPNTLVVCRNGLMATLGAIYADKLKASILYMGIIEVEGSNSGYRDCSRHYMDLKEELLRMDLNNQAFEIRTPLVKMSKKETLELGMRLHVLKYLLKETVSCYQGKPYLGCRECPACLLRNEGLRQFMKENPGFDLPEEYKSF